MVSAERELGGRRFDVVPLRDSAALWQEGEAMRTCLSTYANDCRNQIYIVYSVRAGGRPRPVAHIGLHLAEDGTGRLDQVKGFANSAVEPALLEFAKGLARMEHVAVEPSPGHPHLRSG